MMPKNENDFNNFKDTVYDKYNRPGYLIQRDKYYIFQPFDENEDVTMFYRQNVPINQPNLISIKNYVKQKFGDIKVKVIKEDKNKKETVGYNFDDVLDYYDERDDNFIVGIIDKNLNKLASSEIDLFKIREPRAKNLTKKRGTGIPTLKGAVCATAKDKQYLMKLIKNIPDISKEEINRLDKLTREFICNELRDKLLYLEKYSTTKDGNKITYVMIPANHSIYEFPFNLEDRIKYFIKETNKACDRQVDIQIKKIKGGNFLGKELKDVTSYELSFKNEKFIEKEISIQEKLNKLGYNLQKNLWTKIMI
jgi:hypothetical protein